MSLSRYREYKDSGQEWLAEVPQHWNVKRVKRLVSSIEQGWSPQCENFAVDGEDEWGVLKVGCVNGGVFNPLENKKLPSELRAIPELGIAQGDLLISRANTRELVGSAAVATKDYRNLLLCDKLYRLRLQSEQCTPHFLSCYLSIEEVRGQIELAATGASSSMLNIGQSVILELPVPLPPLKEQLAIAAFLDRETSKIDTLIAEQEKLLALLAKKRQATISHAVTRGLNPDVPMKGSGVAWLGEVPAHWELKALKRAVVLQRGHDLPAEERIEGDIPVVSSGGVSGRHNVAITTGPTIVTGRYGTIGEFTLVKANCWPLNTALYAVQMFNNSPEYLWYMLQSLKEIFVLNSMKSAVPGVDRNDIHPLTICLPPLEEQFDIVAFLDAETSKLDRLKAGAEHAMELLKERRSALISAAVTGKIDVREQQSALEAAA
ncbi:restriction endonuclease subunit S [Paraburkholderia sp. GAS334]|uniref:restriction endonuclease subunit S n=1 Tax=Paraburkholderia sp. GAS334 TaxID=3035131 RepID=UPI003D1D94A1